MPIYEFECPVHGRLERILPLSKSNTLSVVCDFDYGDDENYCELDAEKVWSLPARTDLGAPTRIFRNTRTGEIFAPMTKYDQPPRGYAEVQLKDSFERNKFEREYQRQLDATNEIVTHQLESRKAEITKARHDDIKAKMNAIQREVDPVTGKEVEYTLDHRDKEVLKKAMNRTKKKKFRPRTSDFKIAVNHTNANNMDEVK